MFEVDCKVRYLIWLIPTNKVISRVRILLDAFPTFAVHPVLHDVKRILEMGSIAKLLGEKTRQQEDVGQELVPCCGCTRR